MNLDQEENAMFDAEITLDPNIPAGMLFMSLAIDGRTLRVTVAPQWSEQDVRLLAALEPSLADVIVEAIEEKVGAGRES